MNIRLIIFGCISLILWAVITFLTFGLSESICLQVDQWTGGLFTKEIYQMANGFYYDIPNNDMPTAIYLFLLLIQFVLYFWIIRVITQRKDFTPFTLGFVLFLAIAFRAILLPGILIHENDIYRYLWDGKTAINGINPFKYAPADLFMYENGHTEDYYDPYFKETIKAKDFTDSDVTRLDTLIRLREENPTFYARIGHQQVPTIYPPVMQWIFSLSAFLRTDSIVFMKFIFVLFDLGVVFVLLGILKHLGIHPAYSFIYACSPLVLIEISNSGHYDSVPVFFMMLGIYLCLISKKAWGTGALLWATLSKFFAGVLLPFLIRPLEKRYVFFFGFGAALMYVPYFLWNQTGVRGVFEGLMVYNEQWSYNSSIFALVNALYQSVFLSIKGSYFPAKMTVGILYLLFLCKIWLKKPEGSKDILKACFLSVAALFIINPVGDPWYFCWVIPFLAIFPHRSWLLLSGLIMLSYLNFHSDIKFLEFYILDIPLLSWIIYVPFYAVLIYEGAFGCWNKSDSSCKENNF